VIGFFLALVIQISYANSDSWVSPIRGEMIVAKGKVPSYLTEFHAAKPILKLLKNTKLTDCLVGKRSCSASEKEFVFAPNLAQAEKNVVTLTLQKEGKKKKISFSLLPPNFPYMKISGKSVINYPLIFSVFSTPPHGLPGSHLIVMSPRNELIFYRRIKQISGDFRPHNVNGKSFYSYQLVNEGVNYVGYFGPRVILDEDFNEVETVAQDNDGHEFHYLGPNHWLGIEFELSRLKNGNLYFNKKIVERKGGEVVFSWSVADYLKTRDSELVPNVQFTIYRGEVVIEILHFNSIQIMKDGYFLSMGANGVGFLDKKTRKMTWEMGGIGDQFNLSIDQYPNYLHTPHWDPQTNELILFSNRSYSVVGKFFSRILRYKLDLKEKRVVEYSVLRDKKELSYIMGSLQVTDGILSIGLGTKDIAKLDFVEMQKEQETWTIALGPQWTVYRFYRHPHGELP
jgi:hypothetical protein